MVKRLLLFFGMMSCVLAAAGCSAQKEPAKPDYEKQAENAPKNASPEPTQTPLPEATAAPTAEPEQTAGPENIFDRIPTEGNVWRINEIEREYGIIRGGGPDWTIIRHEMSREDVLEYFGMKLDLAVFLPYLQESPDRKYGFYEYQYAGGGSTGIVPEHSFYYHNNETYNAHDLDGWTQHVTVAFKEGGRPSYSVESFFEDFPEGGPEISQVQGQEVRIVHLVVKREEVVYTQYYVADFLNRDLGVVIESRDMEWEDIKKVIEYLVYYALEREES